MKNSTTSRPIGASAFFALLNLCLAGALAAQTTIVCPENITTCRNPVNYPGAYVSVPNSVPTSLTGHTYLGSYNGHTYFISNTTFTIGAAQSAINYLGGHLAAITSSGENTFIKNALPTSSTYLWIGLNDVASEGTYVWSTGESFSYSNWATGEPNNAGNGNDGTGEDYAAMQYSDGKWTDRGPTYCSAYGGFGCYSTGTNSFKYILEISPDDNFTDHPAAALISGPASGTDFSTGTTTVTLGYGGSNCSFNVTLPAGANTPVVTCPPNITTCTSPVNYQTPLAYIPSTACLPTQFSGYSFLGAFGGHHYFLSNYSATWTTANESAQWLGGYLASVNSAGENDFLLQKTFSSNSDIFIGLNDRATEGTFVWENGDPVTYTNWNTNEPNNSGNEDNVTLLFGTGKWNDIGDYYYISSSSFTAYRRYVVEFEMGECKDWVTPTLVSGPASGAAFPNGTTAVTWGYGGTNCSFNVTVSNPTPTIDCPTNITTCTNPVYYATPSASVPSTGCLPSNIYAYKFIGAYNGHHYFRAQIPATFSNAKLKATGLGGYLASITTAGENDFLRNALKSVGGDFLIGLNDSLTENTFVWANGEAFSYSNWAAGEPNNSSGNDDAVVFQASYLGKWNDVTASTSLPFIVEFESGTSYEEVATPVLTAGLTSGSDFPAGSSTVTWSMGNSNCTFTVTKNAPSATLTCPPNLTVCANPVFYAQPVGRVNCTNATVPTSQSGLVYLGTYGSSSYFLAGGSTTWALARANAHQRGGHLATISSSGENDFLKAAVFANTSTNVHIGLNDEATEGTYVWEDGEPVVYTNWTSGEPNNDGTGEDYTVLNPSTGTWNDIGANNTAFTVVEFDSHQDVVPTLTAGFASGANFPLGSTNVTYSYGSNNCTFNVNLTNPAPTATHCPPDMTVCTNPVFYPTPTADLACTNCALPTSIPGFTPIGTYNGHAYFRSNSKTTWVNAKVLAIGLGGNLASIGSSGENDFVKTAVEYVNFNHWLGGNDLLTEGTFEWTDGSAFSYTNWATNEPNNGGTSANEDAVAMTTDGTWSDLPVNIANVSGNLYFIVEFECPTTTLMNLSAGSLASGSDFPLGQSTVTYNWGGSNCSFNVTRQNPTATLTCPPNITTCASQVFYPTPSVAATCPACVLPSDLEGCTFLGDYGGHRYFLADTAQTYWPRAKNRARALGGYLAVISDRYENLFLKNLLAPLNVNAFIGLNDEVSEGDYVWENGEPFSYARWNASEPNNNFNEDYGQFAGIKGRWNDVNGIAQSYFILEFDGCDTEPTVSLTSGPASGGTFSNGTTTVTWSSGNASCSFTVNVVPPASPSNVTATPSTVSCGASSQLNATTASGGSVRWFTQSTGGTSIGTSQSGQNFSVTPTTTTTYYAETADSSLFGQSTQTLTDSFDFTGAVQYWTAPAWADSLIVDAYGAGGGSNAKDGGLGGRVQTTIPVTPGATYTLVVGGAGQAGVGKMGGGGGGWTGLTTAEGQFLVVAGGGGGAGGSASGCVSSTAGGAGGGPSGGQNAANCYCGTGGLGGTATDTVAVGTGGSSSGQNGSATSGGIGGHGGSNALLQAGGGGGSFGLLGAASSFTINGTNNFASGGAGGFGGGGSGGSNNLSNSNSYEFTKSPGGGGGGGFHAGSGGGGSSSCSSQCGGPGGGGGSSYVIPTGANTAHTQGGGADADQNGWLVIRYKAQPQVCAVPARTPVTVTNTAPILTTQPVNASANVGGNASFTVATDGSNPTFQWQEKTVGGSFVNIANGGIYSGATSATLNLTGVTAGMNNNQYRCLVNNGGCPTLTSDAATLSVIVCPNPPSLTTQPASVSVNPGGDASFTVATDGSNPTFQWQEKTVGGSFANIANGGIYSGATAATLNLTGVTAGMNNYQYRCIVNHGDCPTLTSDAATLTITTCAASGSVWFVDAAAAAGGTGSSWACAFKNLQDAINAASSGQEIWVKAGTYKPTKDPSGNASPADPRDKTFYLKNGVALYGGFAGTETLRSQRNWASNATILSGNIGLAINSSDNSYHVLLSVSDDGTTVVDGFSIQHGNANGAGSITVETKTIPRNEGGGMRNHTSQPTISNCVFSANLATKGGAIFNSDTGGQ